MAELLNVAVDAIAQDYDRLRDDCGVLELPDYGLVTLAGEDRKGWLQGQSTNELRSFTPGSSSAFCVCEATGHLLTVVDAWAGTDQFFLTMAKDTVAAFMRRVELMVVLEDVQVVDAADDYKLFSIQGPTATRKLGELANLPNLDAGESSIEDTPVHLLRSNRTGLGGWDVWVPNGSRKAKEALLSAFKPVSNEAFLIARLEAGIPIFGGDMNAKTLPPEMGPAFEARHVSYNKGCYVGQEVLMRMHSRGHTNRTWVGISSESPLEVGASIAHMSREESGIVTSAVFSPDFGYIGAAMLRNEAAYDRETVRVRTSSGEVEAEVRQMPFLRLG